MNLDPLLKTVAGNIKKDGALMELGCGAGELANAVAARLGNDLKRIVAVDFYNQPEYLDRSVEFIKQDIEHLDIPGTFDLIILNQVLEHMQNPLGLLTNLKKNLTPHGRILIVVPNRYGFNNEARVYLPEHGKHYFLWDKESLEYSLNRIGFVCRFYNLYTAASHSLLMRYLPALFRIQNPNLTCIAMPDIT